MHKPKETGLNPQQKEALTLYDINPRKFDQEDELALADLSSEQLARLASRKLLKGPSLVLKIARKIESISEAIRRRSGMITLATLATGILAGVGVVALNTGNESAAQDVDKKVLAGYVGAHIYTKSIDWTKTMCSLDRDQLEALPAKTWISMGTKRIEAISDMKAEILKKLGDANLTFSTEQLETIARVMDTDEIDAIGLETLLKTDEEKISFLFND
ncbi:hypothetical protein JKY72_04700 [Candidatus Gracilibacteria bacterium]|nr:hypothetical protein [Candidatus Gracilibacteria bacterium]